MSLCLTITSYHKITPGQCPEKSMDQGVMAIGRSSDNDWVLPDPERLVSSQHCVIQYKDGRYYLTDNSTNGVELVKAGIRMRRGNSEPLQDGELIRIGDYEIQARIDFNVQAIDSQPFAGDSPNSFEALMGAVASQPAPTPMIAPQFQGASAMDTLPDLFAFLSPTALPPRALTIRWTGSPCRRLRLACWSMCNRLSSVQTGWSGKWPTSSRARRANSVSLASSSLKLSTLSGCDA